MQSKNLSESRIGVSPHVYEVSSLAYRQLILEGQDQTIMVTGAFDFPRLTSSFDFPHLTFLI